MTHDDALAFLAHAGPWHGMWLDVGAGTGTFTRGLAELLGPQGTALALERDERMVAELQRIAGSADGPAAQIIALRGDMHELAAVVELQGVSLDGVLFANVLHFTETADAVLVQAAERLRPDGRIVVIEYDSRRPNPWVPHPLPMARLIEVAKRAGLGAPTEVARRTSAYQGQMFCAVIPAADSPAVNVGVHH